MKIWRELLGYVKLIVIVVAITLVINNVVLINAKIPSPSMEKAAAAGSILSGGCDRKRQGSNSGNL